MGGKSQRFQFVEPGQYFYLVRQNEHGHYVVDKTTGIYQKVLPGYAVHGVSAEIIRLENRDVVWLLETKSTRIPVHILHDVKKQAALDDARKILQPPLLIAEPVRKPRKIIE